MGPTSVAHLVVEDLDEVNRFAVPSLQFLVQELFDRLKISFLKPLVALGQQSFRVHARPVARTLPFRPTEALLVQGEFRLAAARIVDSSVMILELLVRTSDMLEIGLERGQVDNDLEWFLMVVHHRIPLEIRKSSRLSSGRSLTVGHAQICRHFAEFAASRGVKLQARSINDDLDSFSRCVYYKAHLRQVSSSWSQARSAGAGSESIAS